MRSWSNAALLWAALAMPAAASAQGMIKGRVVTEPSRQGLNGANVLVHIDTTLIATAVTDAQGFFTIRMPAGNYRVTAKLIGYSTQELPATIASSDVLLPAFVLKPESIALAAVEVDVTKKAEVKRGANVAWGERMGRFEQQGARMVTVVRTLNGIRVSEWSDRDGRPRVCVQSRRPKNGLQTSNGCPWVEIVVDGIPIGDGEVFFRSLNVADYESAEFIDGIEAQRYGSRAGQNGALVLWSRGRGPHVSAERTPK
jgi:hypothetical protein